MTGIATQTLQETIEAWDEAAWNLAALAIAAREDCPPELTAAMRQVLAAAGLGAPTSGQIGRQAAAALHQASALAGGHGYDWRDQSDEALVAHGNSGAQAAVAMAGFMLPMLGGLADRTAAPGARMLDVGTGVGALAIGFAKVFPHLQVLGIDIFERALDLARQAIAASDVADRVTVRRQDVADFADESGFDVAWLPAPFISRPALKRGLPRVAEALRPGGWLILGHGKLGGTPVQDALTRFKTIAYGGTPLDEAAACQLLQGAGLVSVKPVPTPAGVPAIAIGQQPAARLP